MVDLVMPEVAFGGEARAVPNLDKLHAAAYTAANPLGNWASGLGKFPSECCGEERNMGAYPNGQVHVLACDILQKSDSLGVIPSPGPAHVCPHLPTRLPTDEPPQVSDYVNSTLEQPLPGASGIRPVASQPSIT